jgi:hypothetical protein
MSWPVLAVMSTVDSGNAGLLHTSLFGEEEEKYGETTT